MKKILYSTNTPWEEKVGYSRAIKVGPYIEISGTTAVDGDKLVGKDDLYAQSIFILKKIEKALHGVGADLTNVIRTRMYITDMSRSEEVMKAHGEFFSKIKPATTLVEVSGLVRKDMLVEIEATAIKEISI